MIRWQHVFVLPTIITIPWKERNFSSFQSTLKSSWCQTTTNDVKQLQTPFAFFQKVFDTKEWSDQGHPNLSANILKIMYAENQTKWLPKNIYWPS